MRNSCLAAGLVVALWGGTANAHEADQYMVRFCGLIPKVTDCPDQMDAFRKLYVAAFKKDGVQARREVATLLWKSKSPVVIGGQWRESCTWFMTMIALGPKGISEADYADMRKVCGLLYPDQLAMAKSNAQVLGRRILSGAKIDVSIPPPPGPDNGALDGTAEPLTRASR